MKFEWIIYSLILLGIILFLKNEIQLKLKNRITSDDYEDPEEIKQPKEEIGVIPYHKPTQEERDEYMAKMGVIMYGKREEPNEVK